MTYRTMAIQRTGVIVKVTNLLQVFSNGILCTAVPQLTGFQVGIACHAVPLR